MATLGSGSCSNQHCENYCGPVRGKLDVQLAGKGDFLDVYVQIQDGKLTMCHLAAGGEVIAEAAVAPHTVMTTRQPKSERAGRPLVFQVDFPPGLHDTKGNTKYIIDPKVPFEHYRWQRALRAIGKMASSPQASAACICPKCPPPVQAPGLTPKKLESFLRDTELSTMEGGLPPG